MNETYPLTRWAEVIDNVDEDEQGKVQVKILPELNGVASDDDLPWAIPYSQCKTGVTAETGEHNVPDIGSHISVLIMDQYWKDIRYKKESPYIRDYYIYEKFAEDNKIDSSELEAPEYPQPRFERTADGVIKFHNTETGDIGLIHPTGAYVLINKAGDVFVRAINQVKIKNKDESFLFHLDIENAKIIIKADSFEFEGTDALWTLDDFQIGDGSDQGILATPLEDVLKELLKHIHIAPSGKTTAAMKSNLTPLSSLQSKLNDMKSEKLTLD